MMILVHHDKNKSLGTSQYLDSMRVEKLHYGALPVFSKIGKAHMYGALRTRCLRSFLVLESLLRDDDSAAF